MPARTGFDTGFFVIHFQGNRQAHRLWDEVIAGKRHGIVSALTLFEIQRLGLRGKIAANYALEAVRSLPHVCEVVWLENVELLKSAARLSHSIGLSSIDALILASFLECGATEIYTVDSDLRSYKAKGVKVIALGRP